jgi:hypothetical protein
MEAQRFTRKLVASLLLAGTMLSAGAVVNSLNTPTVEAAVTAVSSNTFTFTEHFSSYPPVKWAKLVPYKGLMYWVDGTLYSVHYDPVAKIYIGGYRGPGRID